MSYDNSVSEHYLHGHLLKAIEAALPALNKTPESLTIEDLAPIDEFHVGGRLATDHLLDQLKFSEKGHLLDVGCGLGGAARYIASQYDNHVSGIDLSAEYIETGNVLSRWLSLDKQVTLECGSALAMPFQENAFDGAYMLHVGMNIDDKASLFAEVFRVLKPGAAFGIYDVMRECDGELSYPVPWASDASTSKLSTSAQYKQALSDVGFEMVSENSRRVFSLEFFKKLRASTKENGGPPPLGLHTLMQESASNKVKNMVHNIASGFMAPVELIVRKR